jgi:hypothetical protein
MASDRFDDIFDQASHNLSRDEQLKLIEELAKLTRSIHGNGSSQGRSLFDALNENGEIGSITDAPPDLGVNPIHMEGFGQHAP